jgi:accessory colonization factor AcfC
MRIILLALFLLLPSCAYKGDVYLYSPQGAGNVIEKEVAAEIDLPVLP